MPADRVSRGKDFELQVKQGFERVPNCSIDRLHDQTSGFKGSSNICDFIVYKYPHEYYIECKSCYGNTLPFSNITTNQWQGLLDKSAIKGVYAGYLVWFIDHDVTVFVNARIMNQLKLDGRKSLNIKDVDRLCIKIPGTKKRILFNYDFNSFLGG